MRWTSTLVLLLATIAVGVYVSVYDLRQPTQDERRARAHEVIDVAPSDAMSVQIAAPALTATLTRDHDRWRLSAPVSGRADEAAVLRLLYFLHPLSAQRVLHNTPARPLALGDYGLQPPKATLTLTTSHGATTVKFGDSTAVGQSRYAQRGDRPEVYLVRGFVFDALNQPVDAYRSRAVLDIDFTAVARLAMTAPERRYTLARVAAAPGGKPDDQAAASDHWRLVEPIEEEADPTAVARLIGAVQGLRIEQFVAEQPTAEQLAQWGLAAPERRMTLTLEDHETPVELRIGSAVADHNGWRYVSTSAEPTVFAVATAELEPVWADPSTLKAKPPSPSPSPNSSP